MIVIGKANGRNVTFDLKTMLVTRLLLCANSGGGKSWVLRRLAEQIFGHVQTIIVDPEGEFFTLREKFGYILVGENGETPADPRSATMLAERLLELRASAICDLYEAFRSRPGDRRQWVRLFINALLDAPRKLWHPLIVIIDEAHKFCPQESPKAASMLEREIIQGCKEAVIGLATTGRKRGFCSILATQRLAKLDKDASAEMFNRLVGMTIEDVDVDRAADLMSVSKEDKRDFRNSLRTLEPGQFYAFGRAICNERRLVTVGPIQTTHPESGAQKSSLPPPAPKDIQHLLPKLSDLPKEAEDKAKNMAELQRKLREAQATIRIMERAKSAPANEPHQKAQEISVKLMNKAVKDAVVNRDKVWKDTVSRCLANIQHEITMQFHRNKLTEPKPLATTITTALNTNSIVANSPRNFMLNEMHTTHVRKSIDQAVRKEAKKIINGSGEMTPGMVKILQAVARWYPKQITEGQVAAQVKMARSGGTFRTYKSRLSTLGYIAINGNFWVATEAGMTALGENIPETPATTEEIVALWKSKLNPGAVTIFDVIMTGQGEAMDVDEVAEQANMAASGGTFRTYLSHLSRAGLIIRSGKTVAANKETLLL